MNDEHFEKASIINLDKPGPPIKCKFNPKEYAFAKKNSWNRNLQAGENVEDIKFGSGGATTLTLQLFFDTYAEKKDVRKEYTSAIWELMMVDPSLRDDYVPENGKGRPPIVRFQWGKTWSFEAFITSINQKFTLFLPDGTPVRAILDVTFEQLRDEKLFPRQNPTSGGAGGERVWTVSEGDTLQWIAYKEFGDATRWREIADANRLTRVRHLPPGMILVVPNG